MSIKNHDIEFKKESAKLAVESSQPITHTAKELGINYKTLHNWINKYYPKSTNLKKSSLDSSHAEELKQLKKELSRVTQERDILKKAAAYFAKEAR